MLSPSLEQHNDHQPLAIANVVELRPTDGLLVIGPSYGAQNPPIEIVGTPIMSGAPFVGTIEIDISNPGPVGASSYLAWYNPPGVPFGGGTLLDSGSTVNEVDLTASYGIRIFFLPGDYVNGQMYLWQVGYPAVSNTGARVFAVGPAMKLGAGALGTLTDSHSVQVISTGNTSVTMPANPYDGMLQEVKDAAGLIGNGATITVHANAGQYIEQVDNPGLSSGLAGSTTLECAGQAVVFRYSQGAVTWVVVSKTPGSRVVIAGFGATTTLVGEAVVRASSFAAGTNVVLPTNPPGNIRVTVIDFYGAALTHPITVTAGAGDTVQPHTGGAGAATDSIATNSQAVTWEFDKATREWLAISKLL